MTNVEFQSRLADLEAALQSKLGLKGKTLAHRMRRAGRRLPKNLHRSGNLLDQAQTQLAHPKLSRHVNEVAVSKSFDAFKHYLDKVDPADRRKGLLLGWLGGLIFNLIVVAAVVFCFLRLNDLV